MMLSRLVSVGSFFVVFSCFAQDGVSVEKLNRNMTDSGILKLPAKKRVEVLEGDEGRVRPGGYRFKVGGFQFDGATVFSLQELLLTSNVNLLQTYDLSELQVVADVLTSHYRRAGYMVARVWLPPQAIKDGVVTFKVYEGYLSLAEPIRIVSRSVEVDQTWVDEIARQSLCLGGGCAERPLTQDRVDRAVLLVSEITGYQVKGELIPAKELGSTTMLLNVAPRSEKGGNYSLEALLDNFGSQATGVTRGQMRMSTFDLLRDGDQFGVGYMTSDGSNVKNYSLDYSTFIGSSGWRIGAGGGKTNFSLPQASGGYAGDASSSNIYASYPIIRLVDGNVDFRVDYDNVKLSDESVDPQNRRLNVVRVGVSGSELGVVGVTAWGVAVAQSNLKYDDGRSVSLLSPAVGTQNKYSVRLSRTEGIGGGAYFGGNIYGQRASGNLDSYSKLFLGGANAVRAYAGGEVGGDTVALGQFSLGQVWNSNYMTQGGEVDASIFYDRGWARLQQNPGDGVTGNQLIRAGWGLELKLSEKNKYTLRTFWAKGLSGVSTIDGKESRVGLSLGVAF